jgi:hypothetical protein
VAPGLEGLGGGGHGALGVLGIAGGDAAEALAGGGVHEIDGGATRALDPLAADEVAVLGLVEAGGGGGLSRFVHDVLLMVNGKRVSGAPAVAGQAGSKACSGVCGFDARRAHAVWYLSLAGRRNSRPVLR